MKSHPNKNELILRLEEKQRIDKLELMLKELSQKINK